MGFRGAPEHSRQMGKIDPHPFRLRSSLKTKIVLISVACMFFGVGATTVVGGYIFTKEQTRSLESKMLAVGNGLKHQIERVIHLGIPPGEAVGFEEQCRKTYTAYPDIAYAMVLDHSGTILFHHDPSLNGLHVENPAVMQALSSPVEMIVVSSKDGKKYHDAIVPVTNLGGDRVAVVRVGFPSTLVGRKTRSLILYSAGVAVLCFGLSIAGMLLAFRAWITGPLGKLLALIQDVREKGADFPGRVDIASRDEIGQLAHAFNGMIGDLRETTVSKDLLHESEEKYRTVVEQSLVGVYVIQDGLFRFVNPKLCEIFGYGREDLVDRMGPRELTHPDDRDLVRSNIESRLAGTVPSVEYEFRCVRKNGEVFPVKVFGSSVTYAGRTAIMGTLLDLGREKRLEAQLLHAQKLEAVGRMAGGIAHDINNYLGAISGFCELAKIGARGNEELERKMDRAVSMTCKAASLIRQLLAFSKRQPATPRVMNLNDLLEGMDKILQSVAGENITVERNQARDLRNVKIDPIHAEQLLMNLFINAKDAIAGAGTITMATRNEVFSGTVVGGIGTPLEGNYAVLSLTDTGSGIPYDIQGDIFDPFFTTKEKGKGSGLGLSTVYGIVQQNGGCIRFESEPGRGTKFEIYLPACEEAIPPSVFPDSRSSLSDVRPLRILLVEDNDDVRDVVEAMLRKSGFEVTAAAGAEEALGIFRTESGGTDVVITDVIMPGVSGKELVSRIRSEKGDAKVVFISGYTDEIIEVGSIADDNTRFLQKPFSLDVLIEKVKELATAGRG